MAQVTATEPARLPRPIRRVLGRVDWRIRRVGAMRGLGSTFLALAVIVLAGMLVDFAWGLPRLGRWGFWFAGVATLAAGGLVVLKRLAVGRGARALDLAAVVERAEPALAERLTGTVGLSHGPAHGSPALIAALTEDAAAALASVDLRRVVPTAEAWRRLALGLGLAVSVAAVVGLWVDPFGLLARRLLHPEADLPRVGRFVVAVAPGSSAAATGHDLTISATLTPRFGSPAAPGDAWLEWTDAQTGRTRRVAMEPESETTADRTATAARRFRATLPRLSGSLDYRVVSRSGDSPRFQISATDPARVMTIAVRVEPPEYTGFPPFEPRDAQRIEAWEGSRVRLTVTPSAPVRAVDLAWPDRPSDAPPASLAADGMSASIDAIANVSGEYILTLQDARGLTSLPEPARRVEVHADAPPSLAIGETAGLDQAQADDTLRVAVAAKDDVAVSSIELHYQIERSTRADQVASGDQGHVVVPIPTPAGAEARATAALGLKDLRLNPGDVVSYRVRVADNRPAPRGPNVVWSDPARLTIVPRAEPLWARSNQARRETLQAALDAIKRDVAQNRRDAETLRYAADAASRGNGAWDRARQQALTDREAAARETVDRLEALAREFERDEVFRPLARPARQLADVEAEAARAALDHARQADQANQRVADLRMADTRLNAVSVRLDELQRQFHVQAERDLDRHRLQNLADRQAHVADQAEALAKSAHENNTPDVDRAQLDRLDAEQNAVKSDLDALLKKSPELRFEALAAKMAEAESLAKKARELAAAQRIEARRATDLSAHADALRALAEEQRAIENDARRLALDVDLPLAENGRGRLNADLLRQAADPIERGDLPQSRALLQGSEVELRRLARDLAEAPGDLKALARRLARRQDQLIAALGDTLGEHRSKPSVKNAEQPPLAARLAPLADRQQVITHLIEDINKTQRASEPPRPGAPPFPRDAVNKTAEAARKAAELIAKAENPKDAEAAAVAARNALNQLVNALPDPHQREGAARRELADARRLADDATREVERHLRETDNLQAKQPARAATELAKRLTAAVEKSRQAVKKLEDVDPLPLARVAPQRARLKGRIDALGKAAEAVREQAPPEGKPIDAFDSDRARALREALRSALVASRAGVERLDQKLSGQVPADDLALELLDDQHALMRSTDPRTQADDQRRLAVALRGLAAPDARDEQAEAVARADEAVKSLDAHDETASEKTRQAALALASLTARLRDEPAATHEPIQEKSPQTDAPHDPELPINAEHAAQARELARRERRLREQLQGMVAQGMDPQRDLQRQAGELGREAAALRDRVQPLSDRARGPANEAASLLNDQAPRAMDEATQQLAQGQAVPAQAAQRRAAELAERAAQSAEDLADALRAERPANTPEPDPDAKHRPDPGALAAAREALGEASRQLGQARAPEVSRQALDSAQQSMQAAAQQLQAAAESRGPGQQPRAPEPSPSSHPSPGQATAAHGPTRDPRGQRAGVAAPDELQALQDLVRRKTGRHWGELPGHLRTELLELSQGRYRDDYARLIQLYFREIAGAGGEQP